MNLHSVRRHLGRLQPAGIRLIRTYRHMSRNEGPEFRKLSHLVEPHTVAVDVGANVGMYTYALSRIVRQHGKVIAIEPIPHLAQQLRRAVKQLRLPVTVVECVASDSPGSVTLHIPVLRDKPLETRASVIAHGSTTFESIEARAIDLDALLAAETSRVSFLKIDVEGHELAVLRGATKTLEQHHPNILIEIEKRHSPNPIEETFSFLEHHGYRGSWVDETGRSQDISSFDPGRHQQATNAEKGGFYVNNFIFKAENAGRKP